MTTCTKISNQLSAFKNYAGAKYKDLEIACNHYLLKTSIEAKTPGVSIWLALTLKNIQKLNEKLTFPNIVLLTIIYSNVILSLLNIYRFVFIIIIIKINACVELLYYGINLCFKIYTLILTCKYLYHFKKIRTSGDNDENKDLIQNITLYDLTPEEEQQLKDLEDAESKIQSEKAPPATPSKSRRDILLEIKEEKVAQLLGKKISQQLKPLLSNKNKADHKIAFLGVKEALVNQLYKKIAFTVTYIILLMIMVTSIIIFAFYSPLIGTFIFIAAFIIEHLLFKKEKETFDKTEISPNLITRIQHEQARQK